PRATTSGQTPASSVASQMPENGFQTGAVPRRAAGCARMHRSNRLQRLQLSLDSLGQKMPCLPPGSASLQEDRPAGNARQRFLLQIRSPWLTGSFTSTGGNRRKITLQNYETQVSMHLWRLARILSARILKVLTESCSLSVNCLRLLIF